MEINAVTFAVADMGRSLAFYADALGLKTTYGGVGETFTSLQLGANFINLFTHDHPVAFWGRVIIHVSDPDSVHTDITAAVAAGRLAPGCQPHALPADAPWGERYFHVNDPDGHELSFARLL